MTQKEKQLLLVDLCSRLPYGVKVSKVIQNEESEYISNPFEFEYLRHKDGIIIIKNYFDNGMPDIDTICIENIKPYLRPLSSMTHKEYKEYLKTCIFSNEIGDINSLESYDWYNAHHFDYRGLIEKNLAIEAPKDMYKI